MPGGKCSEASTRKYDNAIPCNENEHQEGCETKTSVKHTTEKENGNVVVHERKAENGDKSVKTNQTQASDGSAKCQPPIGTAKLTNSANQLEVKRKSADCSESSTESKVSPSPVKQRDEGGEIDMSLDESFDAEASNIQLPSILDISVVGPQPEPCHTGGGDQMSVWCDIPSPVAYPNEQGVYKVGICK